MLKIIGSVLLAAIGLAMVVSNVPLKPYAAGREVAIIVMGVVAQLCAVWMLFSGMKDYFLKDITALLKQLSEK